MKVMYGTPHCPRCTQLKAQWVAEGKVEGKDYVYMSVGTDITRERFFEQHPTARSFPLVVDLPEGGEAS